MKKTDLFIIGVFLVYLLFMGFFVSNELKQRQQMREYIIENDKQLEQAYINFDHTIKVHDSLISMWDSTIRTYELKLLK
jgi:hypothetical protein